MRYGERHPGLSEDHPDQQNDQVTRNGRSERRAAVSLSNSLLWQHDPARL
jgi:hypothetical protein